MSGGVDSSAAALLLQREGLRVVGVYLRLGPGPSGEEDARRVAQALGIEFHALDFSDLFRRAVMDPFCREYEAGRTPNPCLLCNRALKFGAMMDEADRLGCEWTATGHYVRTEWEGGFCYLRRAPGGKDQSYALYALEQDRLRRVRFPLGGLEKAEVRRLAEEAGLPVAYKPDSQDICFVPDGDYGAFLRAYTGREPQPGDIVGPDGRVLGRHRGLPYYTVGQRKGLGLAAGEPLYVVRLDPERNRVAVGPEGSQYRSALTVRQTVWSDGRAPQRPRRVLAQLRYRAAPAPAWVSAGEAPGEWRVQFDAPQRAVTPGQAAVFYEGERLVGGGVIAEGG